VEEPIAEPEQHTKHTRRWAAFCAASVEFLCGCYSVACPEWVHNPRYILLTPWWPEYASCLSTRIELVHSTPAPFVRRYIFCGNRLYQNKYEMSAWAQEARAKGITNPGEVFRYARQKEISIHGG
jgi:hypothetical protein